VICCTEPGLTRPCIYCIYVKCVTCKMEGGNKHKQKNLTMDNYCWHWLTRDRPDLSSAKFRQYLVPSPKVGSTQRHTDWPSVITRPQVSKNWVLTLWWWCPAIEKKTRSESASKLYWPSYRLSAKLVHSLKCLGYVAGECGWTQNPSIFLQIIPKTPQMYT
jgi:hypothetical protein